MATELATPRKNSRSRKRTPTPPNTDTCAKKVKTEEVKTEEEAEPLEVDARQRDKVIKSLQNELADSLLTRFTQWWNNGDGAKKKIHNDAACAFMKLQRAELSLLDCEHRVSFGKHKGKAYSDMWMKDDEQRYLLWLRSQEWCYEDVKENVDALISFITISETNKLAYAKLCATKE